MADSVVAVLFGIGVAGWSGLKLMQSSGGIMILQDVVGAAKIGSVACIILFTLLKLTFGF